MTLSQLLDLRTLLTTNVISMMLCVLVMTIVWWNNRERFAVTGFWLRSLACQLLAFPLIVLRGILPDTLSILIPAWLITTGFLALLRGMALHLERPQSFRHDFVLQGAFLLIHAYFTYAMPSLLWRSVNYSVFLSWLCLECVWMIFRTPSDRRFGAHTLAFVMGCYAVLFSGRLVYYFFYPPGPDFFQASAYDLFMYVGTQTLLIALTFSLILLVNRRLLHDLVVDVRRRQQTEAAMRDNVERLARAELASKTGNWEFNPDTRALTHSVGTSRILGVSSETIDEAAFKKIVLPEYEASLELAMLALIERGIPYNFEFRIRTVDTGEIKEVQSSAEFDPDRRTVFGVIRDVTEQKRIEHELEYLAQVDPLTGVFSRRHFMALTERELANAARYNTPLSVLMLDIDYFKQVNDTYGHQVGDQALQQLGRILRGLLREVDIAGRYGGEEFAIVLPKTGLIQAFEVAERLRRTIEFGEIPLEHGVPLKITVSIGVTAFRDATENIDGLLARADKALYDAKHQGRNQVCTYETSFDLRY